MNKSAVFAKIEHIGLSLFGHIEIQIAVVVHVGRCRASIRPGKRNAHGPAPLRKGAVGTIDIEEVVRPVVDHVKVGIAIEIEVAPDGMATGSRIGHAHFGGPVRERAVAVVAVEAVRVPIVEHVEIRIAVQIVITPGGGRSPSPVIGSGCGRHVLEAAVTEVAIEAVRVSRVDHV